jgi:hypothetical protein
MFFRDSGKRLICTNLSRNKRKYADCWGSKKTPLFSGRIQDGLRRKISWHPISPRTPSVNARSSVKSPWLKLQKSNVAIGGKTSLAPCAIGSALCWYAFALGGIHWAHKFVWLPICQLVDNSGCSPSVGVVLCLLLCCVAGCEDVQIAWQVCRRDACCLPCGRRVSVSPTREPRALFVQCDDSANEYAVKDLSTVLSWFEPISRD